MGVPPRVLPFVTPRVGLRCVPTGAFARAVALRPAGYRPCVRHKSKASAFVDFLLAFAGPLITGGRTGRQYCETGLPFTGPPWVCSARSRHWAIWLKSRRSFFVITKENRHFLSADSKNPPRPRNSQPSLHHFKETLKTPTIAHAFATSPYGGGAAVPLPTLKTRMGCSEPRIDKTDGLRNQAAGSQ